jgi:acyl carrier protein
MTDEELQARVADVVGRVVGAMAPDPVERACPDDTLVNDLGYYSLRLIELSFAVEELFGMEPMALDDIPPIGLVRDLLDFIALKVRAREATVPDAADIERYLQHV